MIVRGAPLIASLPARCVLCDCISTGAPWCWNCGGNVWDSPYVKAGASRGLTIEELLTPEPPAASPDPGSFAQAMRDWFLGWLTSLDEAQEEYAND
jgi:hypothetical protein